jgi:two-component system sensor histidine kinase QseC
MSLKQRLLLLVLGVVILVWGSVATFVYYDTRHELGDVLEHYSQQVASVFKHHRHERDDDEGDGGAELLELRNELAGKITFTLLFPLLLTLPLLAAVLWWVVAVSLRPLVKLTQAVANRQPDNLAPLDVAAPREVIPLIERLNHLFARTGKLIENERRFTADAAHELRTPMAAIKAQVQVAQGASDPLERQHALDNAVQGCNRATHLIGQLLTLARLESVDTTALQLCPLRTLVSEVMAEIAPQALETGVHLELLEGEAITVNGLPALLQVMVRNLLDNAVRYTPAGTLVQVDISRREGKPYICIRDNGLGLPEAELAKITQRFYRPLGTSASGSGLGLSIVRRIVELHQANLQIAPADNGRGLSVTVEYR